MDNMLSKLDKMIEENLYKAAQYSDVDGELHNYYQGKAESLIELKDTLIGVDESLLNLKEVMGN